MARSDAHRAADARYRAKRVQVPLDFREGDPDLVLLDRLAEQYGSRKGAILEALRRLDAARRGL